MSTETQNETNSKFAELLNSGEYEYYFERGQIVSGFIAEYDSDGILVDIGAKSEAFLPMKEVADYSFSDPSQVLPIGNEYEFYILRDEAANSQDNRIVISYKRVSQARVWASLESVKTDDGICEACIQEVVKGGVVVEIDGLRGFIPASHLRVKGGSNNPQLVGQTIPCMILEIDRQQNKLILSQKLAISQLYAGEREELMKSLVAKLQEYEQELEAGNNPEVIKVNGEVVRITDFGAFIKIQNTEMDGLLPLSEISWRRISSPSNVLNIGDQVTVQVLNVVPEQSRISLSLKRLTVDPWNEVKDSLSVGDVIDVKVMKVVNFGLFISMMIADKPLEEIGFEAFLPLDDMRNTSEVPSNELLSKFEEEQVVKVAVKKIKPEERRIILSTRVLDDNDNLIPGALEPEPQEELSSARSSDEG